MRLYFFYYGESVINHCEFTSFLGIVRLGDQE